MHRTRQTAGGKGKEKVRRRLRERCQAYIDEVDASRRQEKQAKAVWDTILKST